MSTDKERGLLRRTVSAAGKSLAALKFEGVTVKDGVITNGSARVSLAGSHATVDTAGQIDRRLSGTRVLLTGGLGLFWKKKVDRRELYLMVEGVDGAFVVQIEPKKAPEARRFAAALNSAAAKATPPGAPGEVAPPSAADELKKLAELRDAGVISDDEFAAQKTKLLG